MLCLNTIASMINTNVFFDFIDSQTRPGRPLALREEVARTVALLHMNNVAQHGDGGKMRRYMFVVYFVLFVLCCVLCSVLCCVLSSCTFFLYFLLVLLCTFFLYFLVLSSCTFPVFCFSRSEGLLSMFD